MENHAWLECVLRDLHTYAAEHSLHATREALQQAIEIAQEDGAPAIPGPGFKQTRPTQRLH